MPHADFVHLRVHSAYSLSEGAIKADKIAALAREPAMPAVAITDTATCSARWNSARPASAKGVQPIIGCQIALARTDNSRWRRTRWCCWRRTLPGSPICNACRRSASWRAMPG